MRDRLGKLLFDACVNSYYRGCWFGGCRLDRNVLLVSDAGQAQSLEKLFGAALRRVLPDLVIRVEPFTPEKSMLNAAGRKWQAQQPKLGEES